MSIASMAAVFLYLVVIAVTSVAAFMAAKYRQAAAERLSWTIVAAAFAGLALLRLVNAEELMRQSLRRMIVEQGVYSERWSIQGPITALAMLLAAVLITWFVRRAFVANRHRLDLPVRVALLAVLGFVPLLALRVISLHATDQLLYRGPIRLNWLLDVGIALTVFVAATMYIRMSKRLRQRRHSRRS